LSIPSVTCDSIFKNDFSFYSDSVFADDSWISISIVCLTIPCDSNESIFPIDLMRRSCCRFHMSAVTQISVAISRSTGTIFSLTISSQLWWRNHWRFHASTMTLFTLLISCVTRELVFVVNSICQLWLNFQKWFLVLQWLSFRWRFLDRHWHSVFDNSMR